MILTINHPELGPQKSYTSSQSVAGALYSLVENNDDFASGDLVLFGKYGIEKSEILVLTGVTDNNRIDHSTGPIFDHPSRTPIYQILFDQAEIYRATSQTGTYSLVTTVGLNVDEEDTIYNDTGGTTNSWYKIRYVNSQTSVTSDYSDEVQGVGYNDDSLRAMTDDVLEQFGDPDSKEISRTQIRNHLNSAVRRLVLQMIKFYPDYGGAYNTQSLTTGTYVYPDRFIAFKRINIGSSLTSSYRADFIKESDLDPTATYSELSPCVYLRDASWGVYPDCAGKTAYLYYWQYPSVMSNDSDTHGLPYGARDFLVAFALYKTWLNKDVERASPIKKLVDELMKEFLDFVGQSRQASNNNFQSIKFGSEDYEV